MNPQDFVARFGAYADGAGVASGLNRWAILTQWALESGWGTSDLAVNHNNLAGIRCYDVPSQGANRRCLPTNFSSYTSLDAFRQSYVDTLHNGYYQDLLASAGASIEEQLYAFGRSPWDAGHYNDGTGPGSSLVGAFRGSIAPLIPTVAPVDERDRQLAAWHAWLAQAPK